MQLSITFGETEKHLAVFTWGQMFGTVKLTVDGKTVYRGEPMAFQDLERLRNSKSLYHTSVKLHKTFVSKKTPINLTTSWDFEVGETEKHHIHIDKIRPRFFAGARPSLFLVYLDGQLIEERSGY